MTADEAVPDDIEMAEQQAMADAVAAWFERFKDEQP